MHALRSTRPTLATLTASFALLTLASAPLHAQRCLGFAGFAGQPLRLDGRLVGGSHRTDLSADLAFGQATGPFGAVGAGVGDYDEGDGSSVLVMGQIGTQIELGTPTRTSSGAQICPLATIDYQSGPRDGGVDVSGIVLRGGVSLGTSLPLSETTRVVPFGTVSFAYARSTMDFGTSSRSADDVGGVIDLGTGLVLVNRFTVRPSVSIPVGLDGADARFGVAIGFGFGGGR